MAWKILVADDEEAVRDLLMDTLDMFGYDVLLAEDGEGALRRFQQEKADLVLADINMPNMDGFELMRAIRDVDPGIPIVLITGYDISSRQGQAAVQNADGLITKPFNIMELKDLLDRLLGT